MTDVLNIGLRDGELLAEIEMASELMIAAAESEGPVGQDTIDAILHVRPQRQVS